MKKITFFIAFIMCFAGSADAQILKKLGKKAEQAAEKALERKVEQKSKRETEKAFDSTFNKKRDRKKTARRPGLSKVKPAESYAFNHKVEMQITSGKDIIEVNYFLPNTGNFLGTEIVSEQIKDNFITVFDVGREAMFTYMENEGKKVKMGIEFQLDDVEQEPSIDIVATGNTKTIGGYYCREYRMTGEDMIATIWVTKETNIRFPNNFYAVKQNKNNNQQWMKDLDGWAMEMEMIDTSKRKPHTIIMKCLSIEKSDYQINSNDYQNMGF